MKNKIKAAFWLNVAIAVLTAVCVAWMMSGFTFGGHPVSFSAARLQSFKYFTVDSNALMGVIALVMAVVEWQIIKGQRTEKPAWCGPLYLMGATGVTLTMLVTVFFLAPTSKTGYFSLFSNSNFFFHFFIPVLSIVGMVVMERDTKISLKATLFGMLPMFLYAAGYLSNAIAHAEGDKVSKQQDWYGFLAGGLHTIYFVFPLIIAVTYLISLALWKGHNGFGRKK